jgi:outer membrane murein-binding lipoprotein Lpp
MIRIPAPRITLNATQLPPGGALRITGENFGNSSYYNVTVYLNTTRVTPVAGVSVGKDGRIDVNLAIPNTAGPLVYIVNVTLFDTRSGQPCRQFNATAILTVPKAYITLSPSSGTPGTTVTINGYWFQVGADVSAFFDSKSNALSLTPSSVKVKPDGTFTASFIVPSVVSGPHTVGVMAGTTSANATLNVVSIDVQVIMSAIEALERKLDNVLSNLTSPDFGLSTIKAAISLISAKLGVFSGTDTVASLLYEIKASVSAINWTDITAIKGAVEALPSKIDSAKSEIISGLNAKFGAFNGTDTVASLLYDIRSKLEAITAGAQAASGSGATQFTSSQSVVIYSGAKVGTVTVSIKTSGVTYGERLVIRYYLDNTNYIEKVITSSRDTTGWTDTAAAMKVELFYTWR